MNQPKDDKWLGRNWKWAVPVGCLGSLVVVGGFVALIVGIVVTSMKSSEVYKEAVAKARANSFLQKAVGTPMEEGMFVSGNINVSGPSGEANLSIPISGPNGEATIYVVATKSAGLWNFSTLVVDIAQIGQRIDLLELDKARAMYEAAAELDPDSAEARYWQGRVLLLQGKTSEALVEFDKAIEADPRHFESYRNVDWILFHDGQLDRIVQYWDRFIELEPGHAEAYLERAGTHRHKGDMTKALADLRSACDLGNERACEILREQQ